MKILNIIILGMLFVVFTTTISATDVNGRFVVLSIDNSKLEVLLQINTSTGSDDMGGATIVIGFNNYTLNFSQTPQSGTDFVYHSFSGGNYSLATVTRPVDEKVWLNIDLPYNNSNNGTVVQGGNEWTDVVTLFFDIVNASDTLKLTWLANSTFGGIYDADNQTLWNPGTFQNLNHFINNDLTPPQLISVSLIDSVYLEILFSEPLENTSALDLSNYTIDIGITVLYAHLSTNQDKVTLNTSPHTGMQQYTLTVQNLTDLAGNLISPDHNAVQYIFESDITPPEVTEVVPTNTQSIIIKFSERVEPNSAKNKNNYAISNNISINTVQLLPDTSGVLLKTSKHSPDVDYTILVSNVKDRAGNNMPQNSNSYRLPRRIKGGKNKNMIENARSTNWSQNYVPENTIDGEGMSNPSSRWQSSVFMPVSIDYDFGELQPIDSLSISFYKWEAGRLYQYSLYASNDSINWTPVVEEIWSEDMEWTDLMVDSMQARYIKLELIQSNQSPFASLWEIEMFGTDQPNNIEEPEEEIVLSDFSLSQNYPNPFNPSTIISYTVPNLGTGLAPPYVQLKVFDILGNEVATLVDEQKSAGSYEVTFNASGLASGVYIYRLMADNPSTSSRNGQAGQGFVDTKKMLLLR